MAKDRLSHLNQDGEVRMVDVGSKSVTQREAVARAKLLVNANTVRVLSSGESPKGDVLAVARVAGIMAAKRTADLIPLCHPLGLTHAEVQLNLQQTVDGGTIEVTATVRTQDKTGVEMEALTAASISALTVYDMCKSLDREMVIEEVLLLSKKGGRGGEFFHSRVK
jgi:cyclic pyranopterin phosphate synthase